MKDENKNFPDGKIRPDDQGQSLLAIAPDLQRGVVHVKFERVMSWIAFKPESLDIFIRKLEKAKAEVLAYRQANKPS
jgi:hypothetical protein